MQHRRSILAALLVLAASAASAPADTAATKPAAEASAAHPSEKAQFWFGVAVENIPPNFARQLKLDPQQGLMIVSVLPNSPARKAGLQADDIIVEVNGHPLKTQNQLFKAANPDSETGGVTPCKLRYLRGGEPTIVEITPAQRPASMTILGDINSQNGDVRTYIAPNGGGAQIGPGIRLNLATSDPGNYAVNSIRSIVSQGQTIILSQETDVQGNVKNNIIVGNTHYKVDAENISALPENLRPLARELVAGTPQAVTPAPATAPSSVEQRIKDLEAQNLELQKRLLELEKDKHKDASR